MLTQMLTHSIDSAPKVPEGFYWARPPADVNYQSSSDVKGLVLIHSHRGSSPLLSFELQLKLEDTAEIKAPLQ